MVALLPREQHDSRPAVIVGIVGEMPVSVPLWLRPLMPKVASARIADVTVYATDEEAVRQCEGAADDAAQRLDLEVVDGTRAQAWAQPGRLSPSLAHMQEVQLTLREDPTSAQMDIHIKAEPRHLLGDG
jgi:hypothetical protein